LLQLLALDIIT